MNLLHKTTLLSCKLVRTPMDVDADLWDEIGSLFEDLNRRLEVNLSSHGYKIRYYQCCWISELVYTQAKRDL